MCSAPASLPIDVDDTNQRLSGRVDEAKRDLAIQPEAIVVAALAFGKGLALESMA